METVSEVKEFIKLNSEKGTHCPCCGQFVKVYKRKFNTVMVRGLISLYKLGPGYHHVRDIIKGISSTGTNDFSKLRYYGLIQEQCNTDSTKRTSGNWKITPKGELFVLNKISLPKYVFIYNANIEGFSEEFVTIEQALDNKFNYNELML